MIVSGAGEVEAEMEKQVCRWKKKQKGEKWPAAENVTGAKKNDTEMARAEPAVAWGRAVTQNSTEPPVRSQEAPSRLS